MKLRIISAGNQLLAELEVEGARTIGQIKGVLHDLLHVPASHQRLSATTDGAGGDNSILSDATAVEDCAGGGTLAASLILSFPEGSGYFALTVKKLTGSELGLVVSIDESVSALKRRIQQSLAAFAAPNLTLMHRSTVLACSEASLREYSLAAGDTLHVVQHHDALQSPPCPQATSGGASQSQSTAAEALADGSAASATCKKPFHCSVGDCFERIVKVIGDCMYCNKKFCSRHRLPEAHSCSNIQSCKKQSFETNQSRVMKGKCIAGKLL